jgi:hypothetical protein
LALVVILPEPSVTNILIAVLAAATGLIIAKEPTLVASKPFEPDIDLNVNVSVVAD